MKRSYDAIANIYDGLAKLFIGADLRNAQVYLLESVPANARVLIAGGGTGWIIEELATIHPHGLVIDYADISDGMIALAKKRNAGGNIIHFIQHSVLDGNGINKYDVIITPFLLDNFKEENMKQAFQALHQQLLTNGLWLYADFQIAGRYKGFQKLVLFIMYAFFRITCGIEANRLPDVAGCFAEAQYLLLKSKTFRHQFIVASVYRKHKLQ